MRHSQKKRVLVAGGAGFLGTNLCLNLLAEGHEVICLDNFSSGSRYNLKSIKQQKQFSILQQDVSEPVPVEVDEVYNFACCASPIQYQEDPFQTIHSNIAGISRLLDYCVARNIRLFQSSTSEVYGNPSVHPQDESYFGNVNPIGPRACYDEGKRCAETLCMDYHRVRQARVKIARIFNTYGPFMQPQDGRVVSNFIVQALLNQPLTIYGDGSQTRSFCYVDDLITGIRALMASPEDLIGPVNLGNPGEFTVLQLAEQVIELTGSKSEILFQPLPQDDPVKRQPDITRARQHLNWAPQMPLQEGLVHTIAYFDDLLSKKATVTRMSQHTTTEAAQQVLG